MDASSTNQEKTVPEVPGVPFFRNSIKFDEQSDGTYCIIVTYEFDGDDSDVHSITITVNGVSVDSRVVKGKTGKYTVCGDFHDKDRVVIVDEDGSDTYVIPSRDPKPARDSDLLPPDQQPGDKGVTGG